jgi:hypothetical protein
MPDVYFENVHTKNRYKVVSFDQAAGTVTLLGRHGVPFSEKYSKDRFEEMGYRPVQDDAPAVAPAPPAPPTGAAPPPPVSQPAAA